MLVILSVLFKYISLKTKTPNVQPILVIEIVVLGYKTISGSVLNPYKRDSLSLISAMLISLKFIIQNRF